MNLEEHPAGENIFFLRQGIELIRRLDDDRYTACPGVPFRGGVGSQFRHCIDFYNSLLNGLTPGRVDYSARERDPRIETERDHAERCTEKLIDRLTALEASQMTIPLEIKSDVPVMARESSPWSGSTLHRELQFLLSHTIHHYALIASLLKQQGFDLGERFDGFGVARSTLRHWKETDALAT